MSEPGDPDATDFEARLAHDGRLRSSQILLVEDDPDTANLLRLSLELEGYAVRLAADAEKAKEELGTRRADLLLSDYDLPGKSGAVLIREATEAGLLRGVPCVVLTAHPNPKGLDGVPVVRKPIDFARFIDQIRGILATPRAPEAVAAVADRLPLVSEPAAPRIHLVLYVSPESLASRKARLTLESLLQRYDAAQVFYEVVDVSLHPSRAEKDRVVFTPTLVKHAPEPRMWVLGDLSDSAVVTDLLSLSGVQAHP